jgi:tetratricopeptide (TPR) repeat protein/predicted Ser/Thr protein kinase
MTGGRPLDGGVYALPTRLGHYRIIRVLGEGGMGIVYEAEQENPRRTVALKVVKAGWATRDLLRRFDQEALALGRLQHPGIAQVYEAATADGTNGPQPYFVMEFIRGRPLHVYAFARRATTRERLELLLKICEAVHHAHQRGIIHRDLKPGNILVDESGQPKILDFGVARITDCDAHATRQTDVGQLVGTLAYMSPEQASADPAAVDFRSDVYALGVILYELLAGKLPYELGRQLHDATRAILEEDPKRLSAIDRVYRGDIETIVAKALEKDKSRRYASAADLAADIQRYLRDEPIAARPASTTYQLRKFARRHTALVTGVVAVFIVLVGGIVASTWQAARATRAEQAAREEAAVATAINDFLLTDLLSQAGTTTQAGVDVTPDPDLKVRTALDRAATRIDTKFPDRPLVAASVHSTVANAYRELGLLSEAERHYDRMLALRRSELGDEHADTLTAQNNLGQLLREQGKFAPAQQVLTGVLERRRRVLGDEHPDTLITTANVGLVLQEQGNYAEAEPLLTRVLEVETRLRGEGDPETLLSMLNLGKLYTDVGKLDQAETVLRKLVDTGQRTLGAEHHTVIAGMNNLGALYFTQGKLAEAEPIFATLATVSRRIYGDEHHTTLTVLNNLGVMNRQLGNLERAEELLAGVVQVQRRTLGDEHPNQLSSMANLASVYHYRGRRAEAEALYVSTLDGQRRVNGPGHLATINTQRLLGTLYFERNEFARAEPLLRESRTGLLKLRPDYWARYEVDSTLGATLSATGKFAEAEPLLLSGYAGLTRLEKTIPPFHKFMLARSAESIVRHYEASKAPLQAAEWRQKLQSR